MKSDITNVNSRSYGHAKGLNTAIEVHVIKCVLIVPDSTRGAAYFESHEPNTVVSRVGLTPADGCARPSQDGWLHSHRVTDWRKGEIRGATVDRKLAIGGIVEHVALRRMRLAPGEFMGADVCGFAKVGRAWILRWDQIARFHPNPVRYTVVRVAAVIVRT
jgi:hypothetical protein